MGIQNQTSLASLDEVAAHRAAGALGEPKGTGLFAIPDPEKGEFEMNVVIVPDLDYLECMRRARHCVAFKWISHSVMSHQDIQRFRAEDDCSQKRCPDPSTDAGIENKCSEFCMCRVDGVHCF